MFVETDFVDLTTPRQKQVLIDGVLRTVTVLPAGPMDDGNEMVWAKPKAGTRANLHSYAYDGLSAMMDYVQAKADLSNLDSD